MSSLSQRVFHKIKFYPSLIMSLYYYGFLGMGKCVGLNIKKLETTVLLLHFSLVLSMF